MLGPGSLLCTQLSGLAMTTQGARARGSPAHTSLVSFQPLGLLTINLLFTLQPVAPCMAALAT